MYAVGRTRSAIKPTTSPILIIGVAVLASVLIGGVIGIGASIYAIVLLGALVGLALLPRPSVMFFLMIGIIFLLDGLAQSMLGIGQLQWLVSGLGLAVLFGHLLGIARPTSNPYPQPLLFGPILVVAVIFLAIVVVSSAINRISFGQAVVGFRSYFPMWGVFLFMAVGYCQTKTTHKVIWVLIAIAIIQWPFALYQHFFVVTERVVLRIAGSSWDSVVGTFGGNRFGGGQSSSLGIFMSVMFIIVTSLFAHGKITFLRYCLILIACLATLALTETKVVFLLIPIGLAILFRGAIVKRPFAFLSGSVGVLAFLSLVLYSYHALYWEGRSRLSTADDIVARFTYSFKPDYYAAGFWPGRVTALRIWYDGNSMANAPVQSLIGNGAAAAVSTSTVIGQGELPKRFGVGLETTGASKLLWESGVLGLLTFLGLAAAGYACASSVLRSGKLPDEELALFRAAQATLPLYALVVFYETTVVSVLPMQFLLMFTLGYVQYWYVRTRNAPLVT